MAKLGVDAQLIRKLAALLEETGLVELEIKSGDQSIRLARAAMATAAAPAASAPQPMPAAPPTAGPDPNAVTAPMVGVVYLSPEPGAPPFVKPGDAVTEGQTILLIEAMKTFNPVRSPRTGRVARILVADKTPVEYGEELVIIE